MPRAIFIHGFNVRDKGEGTVDRLVPYFHAAGFDIVHDKLDYGWVFLFRLRSRNSSTLQKLLDLIEPGDILVMHSNANVVGHAAAEAGAPLGGVVCINPALHRNVIWPEDLPVLCLHNPDDNAVRAGLVWGWIASAMNPFREAHQWGAAGHYGFTAGQPLVENWDTSKGLYPATGHSGIFKTECLLHWGYKIVQWVVTHSTQRIGAGNESDRRTAAPAAS